MPKERSWTTPSDVLTRRLRETAGVHAFEAVSAFLTLTGLRPAVGWRRLLGWHSSAVAVPTRLIARTERGLELWAAYTGPMPARKLSDHLLYELRVLEIDDPTRRHSFDLISLGGDRIWVSSSYRAITAGWTADAS